MSNFFSFEEFERKRTAWIKQATQKVEQHEKLNVEELVELEEAMQFFADKFGAVITCVTKSKEHFVFTPSEGIKLSDVIFPTEFLENGE